MTTSLLSFFCCGGFCVAFPFYFSFFFFPPLLSLHHICFYAVTWEILFRSWFVFKLSQKRYWGFLLLWSIWDSTRVIRNCMGKKRWCRDNIFWLMNFGGSGPSDDLQAWIVWLNVGCRIHPKGHGQVIPLEWEAEMWASLICFHQLLMLILGNPLNYKSVSRVVVRNISERLSKLKKGLCSLGFNWFSRSDVLKYFLPFWALSECQGDFGVIAEMMIKEMRWNGRNLRFFKLPYSFNLSEVAYEPLICFWNYEKYKNTLV